MKKKKIIAPHKEKARNLIKSAGLEQNGFNISSKLVYKIFFIHRREGDYKRIA